jgi:hypothetical protein
MAEKKKGKAKRKVKKKAKQKRKGKIKQLRKNKVSSDTKASRIEIFKIMEKENDVFGNLLMTINSTMNGKIN